MLEEPKDFNLKVKKDFSKKKTFFQLTLTKLDSLRTIG